MTSLAKYSIRFLLLLVALQILNVGLFAQDFNQIQRPPAGSEETNIINSVAEYIGEVLLQKTNSFPEKRNGAHTHHKHHLVVKQHHLKLIVKDNNTPALTYNIAGTSLFNRFEFHLTGTIKDITPPPPKA